MANKAICVVGMCGAGKSQISEYLMKQKPYGFIRMGQITMDKIAEMGKRPSEALEKEIREGIRKKHGMAAFAIVNLPKIKEMLKEGDTIIDGLYSWEEYLEFKKAFRDSMYVIAVFAPPKERYERLETRSKRHIGDSDQNFRSFTKEEAATRDKAEIENLHKAGPIAMADFTINNSSSFLNLYKQIDDIMEVINK